MRYAIISDIHANIEALEAVFYKIDKENVDQTLCCGDVVGYYANPKECIKLLRSRNVQTLIGNHDLAVAGGKRLDCNWSVAHNAVNWTKSKLDVEDRSYLLELPSNIVTDKFLMFHGALHPRENPQDMYLEHDDDIHRSIKALMHHYSGVKIGFFGHTHIPITYQYKDETFRGFDETIVSLNKDSYYLINPGSVGQSRGKDKRACFLIYDDVEATVTSHRVVYDRKATLKKAKAANLLPDPMIVHYAKRVRNRLKRIFNASFRNS